MIEPLKKQKKLSRGDWAVLGGGSRGSKEDEEGGDEEGEVQGGKVDAQSLMPFETGIRDANMLSSLGDAAQSRCQLASACAPKLL